MHPSDYLTSIIDHKKKDNQFLYDHFGYPHLQAQADQRHQFQDPHNTFTFSSALADTSTLHLIAEIKRASPSKGIINPDFDPLCLSKRYKTHGASCLSILTEVYYFHGHPNFINTVQSDCDLPILRKDFIIDPIQVLETKIMGADCLLLILAILEPESVQPLLNLANDYGLDVIIEVHSESEMQAALKLSNKFMIGINNRDLSTFKVDVNRALQLNNTFKSDLASHILIAESGYTTSEELDTVYEHGFRAVLIGEGLVTQPRLGTYFQNED